MSWNNLKLKEIWEIEDIYTRKEYLNNYHIFMERILPEYMRLLKEKGLNFEFSKDIADMSIQEMSDEIKNFCKNNCILDNQIECHKTLKKDEM